MMPMPMPDDDYTRRARYLGNHDGDTISLEVRLGWGIMVGEPFTFRVLGLNCPELKAPGGPQAWEFTSRWFAGAGDEKWPFVVESVKFDKFGGRFDGHIWRVRDGANLADDLIAAGHAAPWDGRGPKPTPGQRAQP
jgi:endonuclease YncB( thermonuclease family)